MSPRYSLRFETGERRGETIPITGSTFTVGRRPGNSLQIGEASVSGRHAEIVIEGSSARLRDLGSTNGTKLEGERVQEVALAPGARVAFGNVEFSFLDDTPDASRPVATSAVPAADAGNADAGLTVSAEQVARARKGSRVALVVAPLALLGVAAAWWFRGSGAGTAEGIARAQPVESVPGNLLAASYSFEGGEGGEGNALVWTPLEGSSASFTQQVSARASGELGLGVDLAPGEWAAAASEQVPVVAGRGLIARARARTRGSVSIALAVELVPSEKAGEAAAGRPRAWSAPSRTDGEFQGLSLAVRVPDGFASARVLVEARGEGDPSGSADVDDVSLVEGAANESELALGVFRLTLLGEPASAAVLTRGGSVLASEIALESGPATEARSTTPLDVAIDGPGARLSLPAGSRLRVRLEPAALRSGCATLGEEGYSARNADFESAQVSTVLVGRDLDLFGLRCEPPLAVTGRIAEGALLLSIAADERAVVIVQTDFQAERTRAFELARTAEDAERGGRIGPCLAALGELLARYPVQSELVTKAEATSARLTREGLGAVAALRADFERARFFRLLDLFASLQQRNQELAQRYAGSDVVGEIDALAAGIDAELLALRIRRDQHERGRLQAILAGLRAQGATELARAVESYVSEHYEP